MTKLKIKNIKLSRKLCYKEETNSTNDDALSCENTAEECVFLAERQIKGKGSRGRNWQSEKGDGIWMSILLFPKLSAIDIPKITLIGGMAVCTAVRNAGFEAYIKWPNDIVIGGKKVCGILTEKRGERVVIGIGINVNTKHFDSELKNKATSLFLEGGKEIKRETLISSVCSEFDLLYDILKTDGFSALSRKYAELCITVGKKIMVIQPDISYEAESVGITENGELLIVRDGKEEKLCSGEVSVRGIYGYV